MDIRDVSAGKVNASSRAVTTSTARGQAPTGKAGAANPEDGFENSGKLGQIRALIDRLVQAPEVDSDRIARAKALIASGYVDSREAAQRAAGGLVEEQSA